MIKKLEHKDLLKAGVHFGHLTRKWNPKMSEYIFMENNGIHIIDLHKTIDCAYTAAASLQNIAKTGRKIMFVATKKQAKTYVSEKAKELNMPYVTERWLGGMLTNFSTIRKSLKKLSSIDNMLEEDLEYIGAEDYHQLMRAWELKHRLMTSQCVTHHTLFRKETRWPGYYYRGDHMKLDDDNWHCLTVSRRDPNSGQFSLEKAPLYHIVD